MTGDKDSYLFVGILCVLFIVSGGILVGLYVKRVRKK